MTSESGQNLDFSDQTALVTGATRGIGEAIADALGARGATLLLTGTDPDDIERRNAAAPPGRRYLRADFASADGLQAFLDQLASIDRIDVCINNAGINRVDAVDEIDPADWDAVANVNLRAPALITGVVARTMKRHGYGRIVNVSSIWGHRVWEKRATYASTKWGLRGLTAASARDLAADGILVNTVSPGFTDTALVRRNYSEAELASVVNRIPLGRLARTDEIATAVLFLASRGNSYITGQSLVVDGGYGLG